MPTVFTRVFFCNFVYNIFWVHMHCSYSRSNLWVEFHSRIPEAGTLSDIAEETIEIIGGGISRPLYRVPSLTSLMVLRLTPGMLHYGQNVPFLIYPHEPHAYWMMLVSTRAPKNRDSFPVIMSYSLFSCNYHVMHTPFRLYSHRLHYI